MKKQNIINVVVGSVSLVSSNFAVHAGCDFMADKNLQVADGMTTEQIRELIKFAASSIEDRQEQASIEPN